MNISPHINFQTLPIALRKFPGNIDATVWSTWRPRFGTKPISCDPLSFQKEIRRPGSACTVFFFLCRIQNLSQNQKSKIPKLQNPKSKIPKIQNPQNRQNPKSPKFGALGASHKDLLHNGPKSNIQNPQNPKSKIPKIPKSKSGILDFGFWGFLGILDFGDFWGFWGFWILGFWGFWILGILGIWDFGFWDFGEVQGMYH